MLQTLMFDQVFIGVMLFYLQNILFLKEQRRATDD